LRKSSSNWQRSIELRQKPAGTIRITAGDRPAVTILFPKLSKLMAKYPDVKVEINMESGLIDIVAHRFDGGVRLPAAIVPLSTRRAERSGHPETPGAAPRSISPRMSAESSSAALSGFSVFGTLDVHLQVCQTPLYMVDRSARPYAQFVPTAH
jgi:DNA-binding transcriptional LysR family regulator